MARTVRVRGWLLMGGTLTKRARACLVASTPSAGIPVGVVVGGGKTGGWVRGSVEHTVGSPDHRRPVGSLPSGGGAVVGWWDWYGSS